jgi:hypothetical protein
MKVLNMKLKKMPKRKTKINMGSTKLGKCHKEERSMGRNKVGGWVGR